MSDVDELAAGQAGVVSAAQLRAAGITWSTMRAQLAARRWQRAHPGVYSVTTGPLTEWRSPYRTAARGEPEHAACTSYSLAGWQQPPIRLADRRSPRWRTPSST